MPLILMKYVGLKVHFERSDTNSERDITLKFRFSNRIISGSCLNGCEMSAVVKAPSKRCFIEFLDLWDLVKSVCMHCQTVIYYFQCRMSFNELCIQIHLQIRFIQNPNFTNITVLWLYFTDMFMLWWSSAEQTLYKPMRSCTIWQHAKD